MRLDNYDWQIIRNQQEGKLNKYLYNLYHRIEYILLRLNLTDEAWKCLVLKQWN